MMRGCMILHWLKAQRDNDMVKSPNWNPRIATVDSWFDLVESRQHGVASNKIINWSINHPLNANGDENLQCIYSIYILFF